MWRLKNEDQHKVWRLSVKIVFLSAKIPKSTLAGYIPMVPKISSENTTPKLLKTTSTKTWDNWIVITKTKDNQSLRPWIGLVGYVWKTVGLEMDNCSYAYLSFLGLPCDKNTINAVNAPAFYTAHFSLRQRPRFLYWPFLAAAAPPLFILPISCCGSAPAFYTDQFSLRQRARFLYCSILVAAAPLLFVLTISRCGSASAFYTAHFLLRQRPRFLYWPILAAAAPPIFILTGSAINFLLPGSPCGNAPAL